MVRASWDTRGTTSAGAAASDGRALPIDDARAGPRLCFGMSGRQIVSRSIHHKFGKCLACLRSTKKGRGGITQQSSPAPSSGRLPIAASPSACCWLAACALVIELRFPLLLARPNLARHATHSSQTPPFCLLRTKHTGPRGSRRARQQPPTSIADDTAAASTRDCERSYS